MSGTPKIARRILLRLDPDRRSDGGMLAAARLAAALHAELAARLVSDTRVANALAFGQFAQHKHPATSLDALLRRAEASLRRTVAALAEQEQAAWSFEVVECVGVLAAGCGIESDDLVAIELSRLEVAVVDLREEVASALANGRGVLLFPATEHPGTGPIVVIGANPPAASIAEIGKDIAKALHAPFGALDAPDDAGGTATAVRKRKAALAIVDAADPLAREFLARPRFLRELATPLLLLKAV
jgi:hypothetical protein